jgi:hypothetical protein
VNELVVNIAKARAYSPEGALLGTVGPRQISDLANLFEHHSAEVLEFELENGYTVTLDHEGTMVIPNIWFMARWDKLFGRLHYEAKPAANLIAEALRQRAELYLSMDYWLAEGDMRDASFIPKDDGDWQFSVEVKGDELADDEVSYHTEVQVRHNLVRVRPYRDLKILSRAIPAASLKLHWQSWLFRSKLVRWLTHLAGSMSIVPNMVCR